MARSTWHPYAPDQAFGHQAAHDEELLDKALAALEQHRARPPRAGSKARPTGEAPTTSLPHAAMTPRAAGLRLPGWVGASAGLPVTTNIALDAAAALRSEPE
jgi:hypothetical protein